MVYVIKGACVGDSTNVSLGLDCFSLATSELFKCLLAKRQYLQARIQGGGQRDFLVKVMYVVYRSVKLVHSISVEGNINWLS